MITKFWSFVLFAAGVIVGFLIALPVIFFGTFTYKAEFTTGNITQACATILTGIFVAAYVQRIVQADRKEKDILLRHFDSILAGLEEFDETRVNGVVTEMSASLKRVKLASIAAVEILVHLKYPGDVIEQARFEQFINEINDLVTGTPVKAIEEHVSKVKMSAVVKDGISSLTSELKLLVDMKLQQLKIRVFKAQVVVNKSLSN